MSSRAAAAEDPRHPGQQLPLRDINVLVAASGSVAAIRVPRLVTALQRQGAAVKVVATKQARHFLTVEAAVPTDLLFTDEHEWAMWNKLSDPVLHIDLSKWAHVLLVAPASANTVAKLANGLCDNLLTCIAKAWPFGEAERKPFFIAPAMNTVMWKHPTTGAHILALEAMGIHTIQPISKKLACGDTGVGAMEEPDAIVRTVVSTLQQGDRDRVLHAAHMQSERKE